MARGHRGANYEMRRRQREERPARELRRLQRGLKVNRPPPEPLTADAIALRLARELADGHPQAPVHIPRAHAHVLLTWIRNYQARVQEVLSEMAKDGQASTIQLRLRWARKLRRVMSPGSLDRPSATELRLYRPPEPPPASLPRDDERLLTALGDEPPTLAPGVSPEAPSLGETWPEPDRPGQKTRPAWR